MLEIIQQLDLALLEYINGTWHNNYFDRLFILLRNKYLWAPLYIYILTYITFNFSKESRWLIVLLICTVLFSDQLSSAIIKPFFDRWRPCADPAVREQIRQLVYCGQGASFISAHACNHFAIAVFLNRIWKNISTPFAVGLLIWAGTIAYAQVYVGVHYPSDVIVGAMVGALIGGGMYKLAAYLNVLPSSDL